MNAFMLNLTIECAEVRWGEVNYFEDTNYEIKTII